MIIFEAIRWKNFLSTGNNWTEINLIKSKSTLVIGQNGAGKSTMLDAISFALFGRAHRNITKSQLSIVIPNDNILPDIIPSSSIIIRFILKLHCSINLC